MRNPLDRYLVGIYARYYGVVLFLTIALTAPFALRAYVTSVVVIPFAFAGIAALCGTLFQIGVWREFEILSSLGVSFRRIATPLWIATLFPQVLLSAAVITASRASHPSMLVVPCTLFGTVVAAGSAFAIARRRALSRD